MADFVPVYDDDVGWVRVDAVLGADEAAMLAQRCFEFAASLDSPRAGDKPHGATIRLTALDERIPELIGVVQRLFAVVDQIVPADWRVSEVAFRSPGPGTGEQRLHADDLPRLDIDAPTTGATAIIPLVDVDEVNGATRVVSASHRRVDLQRLSQTVRHLPEEEFLAGPAGTAFVFNRHLLHAGSINRSSAPRPVLQITFELANEVVRNDVAAKVGE